ncbi:carboxypeptidase-like regulatory domain-containing protein [bacterium SCSIO 12643]|nr:carboxypeptidase-like regulatory domain-containing protein [bacterium SCSIO 12643]
MSKLKLTIPKPCHEDWSQMTPVEQGRACEICQKNVLDFTRKSDAEIHNTFKSKPQNVCARFKPEQLDRWVEVKRIPQNSIWKSIAAAGVFAFLGHQEVKGNSPQIPISTYQEPTRSVRNQTEIPNTDSIPQEGIVISGTITDSTTHESLPFANVYIADGKWGTQTGFEGEFSFTVPDSLLGQKLILKVSFLGYPQENMEIMIQENMKPLKINMTADSNFIGEVVIVKPTLWQRVKGVFRKKH